MYPPFPDPFCPRNRSGSTNWPIGNWKKYCDTFHSPSWYSSKQRPWCWDASISTTSIPLPVPSMLQCLQVATPSLVILYHDVMIISMFIIFFPLWSSMIIRYIKILHQLIIPNLNAHLSSGWWLTYSEKSWSSSVGMMTFPIYGKS